jgi:hypothetical protein
VNHDQNFKNLILDYPAQALAFFAQAEADGLDLQDGARFVPLRQEQLQERLGERFRELDVPLLVEWPDGRRAALLFVFEEETRPARFSIHRLAHYCLDLAELCQTDRVVPVVIFLQPGDYRQRLTLGSDRQNYLDFRFLDCPLSQLRAADYLASDNLVARLNLPNMAHVPNERVTVYAHAARGLIELEPDEDKRLKYADFIDIYSALDENEQNIYARDYPQEAALMSGFATRFIEQGKQEGRQDGLQEGRQQGREEGRQEGRQEGEALMVLRLLELKFGGNAAAKWQEAVMRADADTLLRWSGRILTAETAEQVFSES